MGKDSHFDKKKSHPLDRLFSYKSYGSPEFRADVEARVMDILRRHRPGFEIRGCNSHMDVLAYAFHHELIAPFLRDQYDKGLLREIDDKGHRAEFTGAWNRVIRGQGKTWDCRSVGDMMVRCSIKDVPDLLQKLIDDEYDEIEQAIISNLPGILSGDASKPKMGWSTRSWVSGEHIAVKFDGLQAIPCNKDGLDLEPPKDLPAFTYTHMFPKWEADEAHEIQAIMCFHGNGIDYDESQKAWEAWRAACNEAGTDKRGFYDSMQGLTVRNLLSITKAGVAHLSLRQDERVSFDISEEGLRLFLGSVTGLDTISDEGQLLIPKRDTWEQILTKGGFTPAEAADYLDRLVKANNAVKADIPAGAKSMVMMDPDTLYAEHMDDYDMIVDVPRDEAICIFAAGTFPMPEMIGAAERKVRLAQANGCGYEL
jgi:hypothetical protein